LIQVPSQHIVLYLGLPRLYDPLKVLHIEQDILTLPRKGLCLIGWMGRSCSGSLEEQAGFGCKRDVLITAVVGLACPLLHMHISMLFRCFQYAFSMLSVCLQYALQNAGEILSPVRRFSLVSLLSNMVRRASTFLLRGR